MDFAAEVGSESTSMYKLLALAIIAAVYFIFHRRFVSRDYVLVILSFAVSWLFLCQTPLYSEHFDILYWGRFLILAVLGLASVFAGIRSGRKVHFRFTAAFPFLLGAYFLLTMLWSVNPDLTMQRSITVVLLAADVLGVIWYAGDSISFLQQTIKAVILPITLLFWGLLPIYGFDMSYVEAGRLRSGGVMWNPNAASVLGALLAPAGYYLWRTAYQGTVVWAGSFLTCLAMVVLSGTRGALAAALLAFTTIALTRRRSSRVITIASVVVVMTGLLSVDADSMPEIARSYLRMDSLATGSGRQEAWAAATELLWERPWTGYGFGTEELLFELFGYRFFEHAGAMAHNSYLGLSVQIGILGAAIFFLPLILVAIKGFRVSVRAKDDIMLSSLLATLVAGLVICFTESWLYSAGNAQSLPFWVLFGILVRLVMNPKSRVIGAFVKRPSTHNEPGSFRPASIQAITRCYPTR